MKISVTQVKQAANKVLETEEKTLSYLVIENSKGEKLVVNVGGKTHDGVLKLIENEKGGK